jgi:hypothetical protein
LGHHFEHPLLFLGQVVVPLQARRRCSGLIIALRLNQKVGKVDMDEEVVA